MKKLNYLFLTICILAIGTLSYAQCTGNDNSSGGLLIDQDGVFCQGEAAGIVIAGATVAAQGDVSGYSFVITNADISMSNDPLAEATLVAGLPITDMAFTYYLTSVAFANGTWTGMNMETIADVTLDPDCTFTSASIAFEYGGASCPPANDMCAGAIDLTANLGQGTDNMITSGPYDNTNASTGADDPTTGWECYGEPDGGGANPTLENTIWFKITGDGGLYFIEATSAGCTVSNGITENDTQMSVYTGTCDALTAIACNEDGPNASSGDYPAALSLQTEAGVDYHILVDGFSFNGANSVGEFCMQITEQASVLCSDAGVGVGTASAIEDVLCQPDDSIAFFVMDQALAPNEGDASGYFWAISAQDLAGSTDPVNAPGFLGAFAVVSALQDTIGLNFLVNGIPPGQYFGTLYAFGNATTDASGALVFDPNCTFVSNSVEVNYYEATEEICVVGVPEVDETVLGMTVFPNPAEDVVNLNINTADYSEAVIMISNVTGQTIQQRVVNLQSGANTFSIDLDNAPAGVYMISVETGSHQSVSRFLKQ